MNPENFTVISDEENQLFQKLKRFYDEIAFLTHYHSTIDEQPVVQTKYLKKSLKKVNENWWKNERTK